MAVYLYKIFDTITGKYIDGEYQSKEIRKLLGIHGEISTRAREGTLVNNRYKIELIGDKTNEKDTFAEEWDKARMKILRGKSAKGH